MDPARLPPPVTPGAAIGVAALSGIVDGERLDRGVACLEEWGFDPVLAQNLRSADGLFAGSDGERLEGFHRLVADPAIEAVVFARGGHGMLRVLPGIDWQLLARRPKAFVGYSDVTPFLLQVAQRLGLVSFHGPMVAADVARGLDGAEKESFLGCLAGEFPRTLPVPDWPRRGAASGPLLGGCLSLLTATLGTPWAAQLEGAILFWEEVAEPLYRLDRMLTHLRLSGSLERITGMLIGHIAWPQEEPRDEAWPWLVKEILKTSRWPIANGVQCGHSSPNLTLPIGIQARFEPNGDEVILGEGDSW